MLGTVSRICLLTLVYPIPGRQLGESPTHGNAQSTNRDLNSCDDDNNMLDTALNKPVVGEPSQYEAEEVFEDDHQSETLYRQVP